MSEQLIHSQYSPTSNELNIILLCDGIKGPANQGSVFRIADAFGVAKIVFSNAKVHIDSARLHKTARNTHKIVPYIISENILEILEHFHQTGFYSIGLEITKSSKPIQKVNFQSHHKIVLVLGNENEGISQNVMDKLQMLLHINMFGANSSMNVTHAAAIALFEITKNES